jgi:hypothetical protein
MSKRERRDCAICGHDITMHAWIAGEPWPCVGTASGAEPSNCPCEDFKRAAKGARRIRLGRDGKRLT